MIISYYREISFLRAFRINSVSADDIQQVQYTFSHTGAENRDRAVGEESTHSITELC